MGKIRKILVLWAGWMLWNAVYKTLLENSNFKVIGTFSGAPKKETDLIFRITKDNITGDLERLLSERYDYIINCIGMIRPEDTTESVASSFLINSYFPQILREIASKNNSRVIHVSTDCVFSWKKWCYTENDIPDETGVYGVSKFLWENKYPPHITLRTSIIWRETSGTKRNLLDWFLQTNETQVKWYDHVYWNGITTVCLSKIIRRIIEWDMLQDVWFLQIWGEEISKYNLLKLISKIFQKNIEIIPDSTIVSDKTIIWSASQTLFQDLISDYETQLNELKNFYEQ